MLGTSLLFVFLFIAVGDALESKGPNTSTHGNGANLTNFPLASSIPPLDRRNFTFETYSGVQELRYLRGNFTLSHHLQRRQPTRPAVVDWRNRFGVNWLASVQNQGSCQSCSFFGVAALVETQVRIEHGYWSKRSEGDIRDGDFSSTLPGRVITASQFCAQSASVIEPLLFAEIYGAADPDCFPYSTNVPDPYTPCADREGRTTKIPKYTSVGSLEDQKNWLYLQGPLIASLDFPNDLQNPKTGTPGKGVYRAPTSPVPLATVGHTWLIVGYDDNQGAWIVRNQYSTSWGDNGYLLVAYGEMNIDYYGKEGITSTDPDPRTKRGKHNGNMIHKGQDAQGISGDLKKNFAIILCGSSGIWQFNRAAGEQGNFNWAGFGRKPSVVEFPASEQGSCIGQPSFTDTTYTRNLEFLYWHNRGFIIHWYFEQREAAWHSGGSFGNGQIEGYPGFIQGNYGAPGNFEAVVRHRDGSLNHWWRQGNSRTWNFGGVVSASGIRMSGPSLVQANVGSKGNFYVVAVIDEGLSLKLFWRNNDDPTLPWASGETFGGLVGITAPCMIQTNYGTTDEHSIGDFEVLVAVFGNAVRYRRDNSDLRAGGTPRADNGAGPWIQVDFFGAPRVKHVWSFMQGPFYQNLEAIVELFDGTKQHWFHDGTGWHYGQDVPSVS